MSQKGSTVGFAFMSFAGGYSFMLRDGPSWTVVWFMVLGFLVLSAVYFELRQPRLGFWKEAKRFIQPITYLVVVILAQTGHFNGYIGGVANIAIHVVSSLAILAWFAWLDIKGYLKNNL